MAPIDDAIAEIESLKSDKDFSYQAIADRHNVWASTLRRRHQGLTRSLDNKNLMQRKLYPTEEAMLVQYIEQLSERYIAPTREMVRNFACQIAQNDLSESWVTRFINRNNISLISRWATPMDRDRHNADSAGKYQLYFELLQRKIEQYNIDSRYIYNMDEKGFAIGVQQKTKRIFSKSEFKRKKARQSLQDGNRQWITLLACACADGSSLSPAILFPSKNSTIQRRWVDTIKAAKHDIFISSTPSGWTNDETGLAWLKQVFDRKTRDKARNLYRLLILDGHGSHITMDFIKYCDQRKILLMVFPPHSTHTLQPLDVGLFSPLQTYYSKELDRFNFQVQGLVPIKTGDFFSLFWKSWQFAFTEENVRSAFQSTGISPLNGKVVVDRFTKEPPEPVTPCSEALLEIDFDDWRAIDRLVVASVKDTTTAEALKVRQAVHQISINNQLLRYENTGLREGVKIKKRHKKKPYPLDLQHDEQSGGGAVFWSPQKLKDAEDRMVRERQQQRNAEIAKAEAKELKKAAAMLKKIQAQEKREERAATKLAKKKAEAEKRAARQAEKEARAARQAIQLSQKGKRKASSTPSQKNKRRRTRSGGTAATEVARGPAAASTQTTRIGRATHLPSKFK